MRVERKISSIPAPLLLMFVSMLLIQIMATWLASTNENTTYEPLSPPYSALAYRLGSLDSLSLAAQLLTLKLQLHDNQKGKFLNYRHMSYPLLSSWLIKLQSLNSDSEYSALLATRVFSNTSDKKQLKTILETVITLFNKNPIKNWRWMAEGAVIAKYNLKNLDLALRMAKEITKQPKNKVIPKWARDLEFIILEEMNMIEAATYIVEHSLQDKSNMHPDERRFLEQRLSVLKQKSVRNSTHITK